MHHRTLTGFVPDPQSESAGKAVNCHGIFNASVETLNPDNTQQPRTIIFDTNDIKSGNQGVVYINATIDGGRCAIKTFKAPEPTSTGIVPNTHINFMCPRHTPPPHNNHQTPLPFIASPEKHNLKKIPPEFNLHKQLTRAASSDESIALLLGLFKYDSKWHAVMRFYDTTLRDLMAVIEELRVNCHNKKLPHDDRVTLQNLHKKIIYELYVKMISALIFFNQQQIVHCDLKPENIFNNLEEGLLVKVGDFGSSVFVKDTETPRTAYGTPQYMSPQSYDIHLDKYADIFSVGRMLIEILMGKINQMSMMQLHDMLDRMKSRVEQICDIHQTRASADFEKKEICIKAEKMRQRELLEMQMQDSEAMEPDVGFYGLLQTTATAMQHIISDVRPDLEILKKVALKAKELLPPNAEEEYPVSSICAFFKAALESSTASEGSPAPQSK